MYPQFLYYLIQTEKFYSISNLSSGSKMPRSDWNLVSNYKFQFPQQIQESVKIGQLLAMVDKLLSLQQRKLELLKQLKKGSLQRIFPQNQQMIPDLRFAKFTKTWKQQKLGDLGETITGNTPSTKDQTNWTTDKALGHAWITPTDIHDTTTYDSERHLSDKKWQQAKIVPQDSVLITSIASIGKNTINKVEAAFNQQINALVLKNNNPYFVLSLMDKEHQRFESLAGQTATPIINKTTFTSFIIKVPLENEQNMIGAFLKQVDHFITLHQHKITMLYQLKQFLLQQMFI